MQKKVVAKLAGRVTVDGKAPRKDCKLFLVLNDPEHLDENAKGILPKYFTWCDESGAFEFSTYEKGDGAPVGKYVVTFVELHRKAAAKASKSKQGGLPPAPGSRAAKGGPSNRYIEPDELHALYSNPDANAKDKAFVLDLPNGGKSDCRFDLVVGDKPALKPARHAVRTLVLNPWP